MRNTHKRTITAHELCYLLSTRKSTEETYKNGQRDHVNQNGCPTTVGTLTNRWNSGKQFSNEHFLDYAKDPMTSSETEITDSSTRNQFIDDLKQTLHACRVFVFFPIFWICFNQEVTNLTSQAAQMNVGK